jgi:hypothetical protein
VINLVMEVLQLFSLPDKEAEEEEEEEDYAGIEHCFSGN